MKNYIQSGYKPIEINHETTPNKATWDYHTCDLIKPDQNGFLRFIKKGEKKGESKI